MPVLSSQIAETVSAVETAQQTAVSRNNVRPSAGVDQYSVNHFILQRR